MIEEEKGKHVPLPLKHTDVKATIEGYIATVDVVQQFHNPYDEQDRSGLCLSRCRRTRPSTSS